jgi:hypothetical protein
LLETMPKPRRRSSDPAAGGRDPLRSSLANAAWAVEDRVVWGAADVFRALVEVVKWPFERIAWALEHWLIWPIQEETALWSRPVRVAVLSAVLLLAGAGVAAGILVSDPSGNGGEGSRVVEVSAQDATPPVISGRQATGAAGTDAAKALGATAVAKAVTGGQVLEGSSPKFAPSEHGGGVPKAQAATEPAAIDAAGKSAAGTGANSGDSGAQGKPAGATGSDVAGPGAIKVARKFAAAFVLYETGHDTAKVKAAFHRTATPDLAKALIKRPPRLPANVEVPKAKVLNIVAGPRHGDTYTISVSMLRVGVTSELRLDMQKTPGGGGQADGAGTGPQSAKSAGNSKWLVTDVLG